MNMRISGTTISFDDVASVMQAEKTLNDQGWGEKATIYGKGLVFDDSATAQLAYEILKGQSRARTTEFDLRGNTIVFQDAGTAKWGKGVLQGNGMHGLETQAGTTLTFDDSTTAQQAYEILQSANQNRSETIARSTVEKIKLST